MGVRIYAIGLICTDLLAFKIRLQEMLSEIPKEKTFVVGKGFVTPWAGRTAPHGPGTVLLSPAGARG